MSKSRFRGRLSVLDPDWILAGTQSRSATPTTTSKNGSSSNIASSEDQYISSDKSNSEPDQTSNSLDGTHEVENTKPIVLNDATTPPRKKAKSRYTKLHTSSWTMSSTENDMQPHKEAPQPAKSKLKSWTQGFMGEIMSTEKAATLTSSDPIVPPAPFRHKVGTRFRGFKVALEQNPGWKFTRKHLDDSSKHSAKSSISSPKDTSQVTPTSSLDRNRKSIENPLAVNKVSLEPEEAAHKEEPKHEETAPKSDDLSTDEAVRISDVALTLAIDCSGSTSGKVLEEEKRTISGISKLLSQEAQERVVILPWNDEAETPLSLPELEELFSSGGTDPTVLIRDLHHRQALANASLWVLITDGEIDEFLVKEFAMGIGDAGIHGTASIVVCVGQTTKPPARCNISVGKSVFAVVPDCMFLFHDVRTGRVYILGCKGRFHSLIPGSGQSPVIDNSTTWEDLPQIPYEALRDFHVPKKRNLSPNTVLLTSGKKFDLGDIYNDTLDPTLTSEILSNDDDLKTLLLTASTRGRKEEVKTWVSKKKLQVSDPLWIPRPDIGQRALHGMERLVEALRDPVAVGIPGLREDLQTAHEANWKKFATAISAEKNDAITRDVVIADATARLQLIDLEPDSPHQMSPVSRILRHAPGQPNVNYQPPETLHLNPYDPQNSYTQPDMYEESYLYGQSYMENTYTQPHAYMANQSYYPPSNYSSSTRHQRRDASPPPPSPHVLFSQGYKCKERRATSDSTFDGTCTLCTRSTQVMALILKKPEEDEPTANYPEPQQYVKHKFPFALGNFPDVDILSPELYCETCSVYLLRHGKTPKAERIIGALPLVHTHGNEYSVNLKTWIETLRKGFEGRFHDDIVLSVFLSVLCNTLDDLTTIDSSENTQLTRAIRWACRNILQSLLVYRESETIPLGQSPPWNAATLSPPASSATLGETIPRLIKKAIHGNGPLLNYPLDGFLVLILAARDIDNENCERESLRCVVWLRTIFHMAECHYSCIRKDGLEKARGRLHQILHSQSRDANTGSSSQNSALVGSSITLASLKETHLLSSDDLETFRRMGPLFTHIGSKCGAAIAVFLQYLLEYSYMCSNAMDCFEIMREQKALRKAFVAPEQVDNRQATDLISQLQNTKNG
ncbi:hypothetical protein K505DRAFT_378963 [Melanomma pulvis-pyrius CBS 109.77]|uniref:VWFA domain-containing protein n=1 Tax=Melanomma pulvis-pyrius CBS 109.77 TaxID=1314802 RepID=A0A6A6WWR5_9PLEO|nr:hypothetical protein K505DRAFT_378963 [Melanomma pulvis-pyrius CBS 109.77]